MQQKILLINSMEKLINHIVVSKKNQEEIFASLSKNDFKKIISNLEDENLRLRKISLALISQLLYNNPLLKEKFCHIMNIPLCPGRVALNTKLCASSNRNKNNIAVDMTKNIKEVFALLKQAISEHEKQCLFWFINYDNKNHAYLQLEYLTTPLAQNINVNDLLDPLDCMIGFILPERTIAKKVEIPPSTGITQTRRRSEYEATSNRLVNNYFKPTTYKPTQINQVPPASLNQSLNLNPGYTTDREKHFFPKSGISTQSKGVNSSMHQEPNSYSKAQQTGSSYQQRPVGMQTESMMNKGKYTGIKLISNTTSTTKNRQTSGKYYEDNALFNGSVTSNANKTVAFNGGGVGVGYTGMNKPLNVNPRERGYQTLREKKIIQKYPI